MSEDSVSLRNSVTWGAVAFGVSLAVVIGVRLDEAALAAVVGVVCGVGASIPTGLLILLLVRRGARDERRGARGEGRERGNAPPVVVVAPSNAAGLPQPGAWSMTSGPYAAPQPTQRQFAVIGGEDWEEEFTRWPE